ncbi:hypothetical protein QSV35_12245 [Microbacterium sp. ASV49]|uniref:Uncharacterized protein n=1 Tax=Microbacterium candidum TaxID=3041922 RepID=A0ABT7N079_9MICO|nr:hypothetical protein [Microbacterium sp. ASV49]MDL9980104.1 hypothetical protein [Microbacterium sp. ASV49]
MVVDVAQELLEFGALRDGLGRLSGFDELSSDRHAELSNLPQRFDALRGDAVTVLVDVSGGVQLARRRDAQVDDSLRDGHLRVFAGARRWRLEEMLEAIERIRGSVQLRGMGALLAHWHGPSG